MSSNLLDRPLGELTLRELATIARAAQAMSAALETEVVVARPERLPLPARAVAKAAKAYGTKRLAKVASGSNGTVPQSPGKGRKACPKCHETTGTRAAECICGHKFAVGV